MRGDLLAVVCARDVHQTGVMGESCPRWCDAGWLAGSQFGSPYAAPVVARGSTTVPWDNILVTGATAMIAKPIPYVDARPYRPEAFARWSGDRTFQTTAQQIADAQPLTPLIEAGMRASMDLQANADQAEHIDRQDALQGIRALLRLMGEDPDREGLEDTPARVVKAYLEMASRPGDPAELLSRVFGDVGQSSEMICVPGIRFVSLCEHHLLPFTGTAAVAYIPRPGGAVVGLSKIPRLVHHWAMRPQVQERLTRQIADSLQDGLTEGGPDGPGLAPLGVAVRIDSTHSCMSLRGVKADAASMVTSDLRGRFLEGPARAEFLSEAQR